MNIRRSALLAALVAAWVLLSAAAAGRRELIRLSIPLFAVWVEANDSAVIPHADVKSFDVLIQKQPSELDYGSIFSKINTEAANIVMTTQSTSEGIVCHFDLTRRGGFDLKPGRNSVEISYFDRLKRVHYASFLLQTAQGAQPGKTPPSSRPERLRGAKYAVVIGVSLYKNSSAGVSNLKFAAHDAQAFRDFLLSPEGGDFRPENVLYLVNENATAQNVRSALFTFLTRSHAEDLVVLYFAGHGAADPNDRRNLYLLTYDTNPDDMGGTAFPMWQLQDVFSRIIKAKRVITFADSCHSYGISGQSNLPAKSNNLVNQYLSRYAGDVDRAVITASDISQLSYEGEQWGGGHGVFSYFVLQGLKGAADGNKDGTVTAGELFAYIRSNVAEATGGQQTPIALAGLADNLPLSGIGLRKTARLRSPSPLP